jgi:hypothetical protein
MSKEVYDKNEDTLVDPENLGTGTADNSTFLRGTLLAQVLT